MSQIPKNNLFKSIVFFNNNVIESKYIINNSQKLQFKENKDSPLIQICLNSKIVNFKYQTIPEFLEDKRGFFKYVELTIINTGIARDSNCYELTLVAIPKNPYLHPIHIGQNLTLNIKSNSEIAFLPHYKKFEERVFMTFDEEYYTFPNLSTIDENIKLELYFINGKEYFYNFLNYKRLHRLLLLSNMNLETIMDNFYKSVPTKKEWLNEK